MSDDNYMPVTPYKGLVPYSEADAPFFFGREKWIEIISNQLRRASRLILLYGASGVGKSSVLRAGVARHLRHVAEQNLKKYGAPEFAVIVFSSWRERNLLKSLKEEIQKDIKKIIVLKPDLKIQPPDPSCSLTKTLREWTKQIGGEEGSGELFIILDQFEEYFLYHSQEEGEETFAKEFPKAVNDLSLPVNFLISIREDSLAKLDYFKNSIRNLFQNYLRIEHLDRDSATNAIVKPVQEYIQRYSDELGLNKHSVNPEKLVDPKLVKEVLEQVSQYFGDKNGLGGTEKRQKQIEAPYLQLVMTYLWWKEVGVRWKDISEERALLAFWLKVLQQSQLLEAEKLALWSLGFVYHLIAVIIDHIQQNIKKRVEAEAFLLRLESLENLGGKRATKNIVEAYFTNKMNLLKPPQKDVAAIVFQYLVTPGGMKIAYPVLSLVDLTRCSSEELQSLLIKLDEQRIVRTVRLSSDTSEQGYEIFHDVLAQPILDWRRRYLDKKLREQEREKEKQLRIRSIKQGLAAQSLRQQRRRQDKLAALLARQAYRFNQQEPLHILAQVDDALRQALSAPYFSNILKHDSVAFSSIAFSPDGTKLAAGGWDGNIYLWNQEQSYSEFKPLVGHEKGINAIAFSLDGQWLVSGSRDKTIRLWDLRQNDPVSQVIGKHEQEVTSIAFKPDGSLLASGSKDRTVKLWNWHQIEQVPIVLAEYRSKGQMGMVRSLTFSPYGSQLAVGCDDRTLWLWDVQEPTQTPDKEPSVCYGHGNKIRSVAFSPGGRWLASASDDCTIRLWDITQPQKPPQILQDHTAPVRTVAFSPDGNMLASGSDGQTIRLWKTDKLGKTDRLGEAFQILRGHTFNITSVAFSPDGQHLASGAWDNTVRLWDLNPPIAAPKILPRHQNTVRAIAISQQDQEEPLLASGSEDGTVRVWNLNRLDAELKTFKRCGKVFGVALFVSSDRQVQLLAAGSDDKIVRLWDLQQPSNDPLRQFEGHKDGVSSVAFSPDGQWLASSSWDRTVRLWNLNQLDTEPIIFKGHTDSVTSVAFSPDGTILASASNDQTVLLWNLEQPDASPIVLKDHIGRVWSIAFSPTEQLLALASEDWTVRLWNLKHLALENPNPENLVHVPLKGHSAWVSSVAFSPDGEVLASGSFDRSIRLWQINQIDWKSRKIKEYPIVLEDHNQSVTSVAFTPDGKYLASGSYDNTIRLWIARTEDLADIVGQKVLRNLSQEEWQWFMGLDIPYERTCPNLPPGEGTSKVARVEKVSESELEREFRDKLAQLFTGQKSILEFIKRTTEQQPDISEEDVTNFLNKPKGDAETFYRLETLRLLDFLQITEPGHGYGTIRYGLSPNYQEYLMKSRIHQTKESPTYGNTG